MAVQAHAGIFIANGEMIFLHIEPVDVDRQHILQRGMFLYSKLKLSLVQSVTGAYRL